MTLSRIKIAALAFLAATLGAGTAEAQWYSSAQSAPAPLYPYAQSSRTASQPYAVEVAPGAYVIHRPGEASAPSARRTHRAAPVPKASAGKPSQAKPSRATNDPALIDELRQQVAGKKSVINTTKVVYRKPKVVETKRYVDLPPRVVERYTVIDDSDGGKKFEIEAPAAEAQGKKDKPAKGSAKGSAKDSGKGSTKSGSRVIQADAEITIFGPDRMTIQLYRKGELGKPGARLN